ncbi:uncharacterized protein CDAR_300941 [Caerostris darwini]|uniref:Uncharacterized protein n=1 Tax=Caerostris darwini TaxID=1538125 RepID=A0AAV4WC48_9ARAC|nr:uncharacterized protein CDAR_300941 [Caerostris darwini]
MKPGSLILYIDNAGGGFHQLLRKEAGIFKMKTLFGPLKHELYSNPSFNVKRFGYTPCLETKVTVHIWSKHLQRAHSNMNDSCEDGTSILNPITDSNHPNVAPNNNRGSGRPVQRPAVDNPAINYRFPSYDPFDNQNVLRNAPNLAWENWPPIPPPQPPCYIHGVHSSGAQGTPKRKVPAQPPVLNRPQANGPQFSKKNVASNNPNLNDRKALSIIFYKNSLLCAFLQRIKKLFSKRKIKSILWVTKTVLFFFLEYA